ncbi:envelope stress response membrane protein PspC [Acerihabitans arboris]|uniref:Envelope stress response membrane protein PspC n=1 Tax=Acerihabitans arboris TaxID=2691583 RepID=A0A845SH51_9GAMM|nr:envelope stress response membrane protein PspC [Acerihabitans arboris]NDL62376.1 envelope stress response membrane protein PspC [Acerihabitans arboris]
MAHTFKQPLYLRPDEGMCKGVCAGVAHYLDVPVKLVRIIVVLSMFFGLFLLTIVAYAILAYWLEPAPADEASAERSRMAPSQQLDLLELRLDDSEQHLRQVERYVTSETFGVRNRFRRL